jgi:outer membrane protein assembly factor BamB
LTIVFVCSSQAAIGAEPWCTYRGNAQRTGNADGKPGPTNPAVLWVHRGADHFVAAATPSTDQLFLPGIGGFNVPTLFSFALDSKANPRATWVKTAPFLKLPSVSSPALADGKLLFGDGMHQNDGAVLYCLGQDRGLPLWQLPLPGTLVHLEGSPAVADGKVYFGAGSAGVLCVDLNRVTLDGKAMDVAQVKQLLDKKWAELLEAYKKELKKDPDFAVMPREDQLPRPAPQRHWQQGEKKWHVDAPVAVAGDLVLVGTAFLDKEQLGDRALVALDAKTGSIRWRAPLRLNPWGGPSVQGQTVVVGGSTIGYDPKAIKGARGEVAAFELAEGKEKWRKEVPGGIVSCVALAGDLAIATVTDGKVRAFALADGERRWVFDAKAPLFAPVAVAGGVAYAGDLAGVVHAINLTDGQAKWALDLGADPVKAPGMIYGGPVVQDGRLYVATCNLEGPHARKPTVVVCIGER